VFFKLLENNVFFNNPLLSDLDKIKQERLKDWLEDGNHLLKEFEFANALYRKKICSKCRNTLQQKTRNCIEREGRDILGNPKTNCMYMRIAVHSKLRNKIHAHIDFHPLIQRNIINNLNKKILKQ